MGGSGTSTSGLIFGKGPPYTGATEIWNGSTWTEIADLATARGSGGSSRTAGTASAALFFNGEAAPGQTVLTEEWTAGSSTNSTLTAS
jgi:hypothetical protein